MFYINIRLEPITKPKVIDFLYRVSLQKTLYARKYKKAGQLGLLQVKIYTIWNMHITSPPLLRNDHMESQMSHGQNCWCNLMSQIVTLHTGSPLRHFLFDICTADLIERTQQDDNTDPASVSKT